jgi:hypothetical protein
VCGCTLYDLYTYSAYANDPRDGTGLGQRGQDNPSPVDYQRGNNIKTKNNHPDKIRRCPQHNVHT